ncbi:MAG: PhzF family phenazine biosynthesis protein [Firmicutes bacterium]|nr:PhzF family phenazine biosynthesis protein [Bacillota bacterium]
MARRFYMVDVFAEEKYAGNQLAVVRDCSGLSDAGMQRIAREINFSETTFILSEKEREGGFDVRIFTPEDEVPFAGHPTLGTAYVIRNEILNSTVERVSLNLKVGQIPVTFGEGGDSGVLWMRQRHPVFGPVHDPRPIAEVLGLDPADFDDRFPVQEVSTGLPFFMTPLKTIDAVRRIVVRRDRLMNLTEKTEAKDILVFCPETVEEGNNLHVRVFVEYHGIPEDPATGSANGCLAGYLVKHGYFGSSEIDVRVEQGYEIGRPSLLLLRAKESETGVDVRVGGKVVMVARGELV